MNNLLVMPPRTFTAKLFTVPWESNSFKLAGTLDGFIDLAVPCGGTYPLSLGEAKQLASALTSAIVDIESNCLYEKDALQSPPEES